ncbi:hypothetical protein [Aquabacterium sp. CECT 9606]|uniref:hypothetical protein n=1 Tax=Aquabacterium sp. CECT 9606 TaxID=2845822 RepID=UPI001E4E3597|nr:hypothetical protein [Aquabacterium sp. CECT 9606]
MPKHLLVACLLYVASRTAMAALAPLYETGFAQVTSPLLMLLFSMFSVLFMRRVQWTWKYMKGIAFAEIALNVLFFPEPKFHGIYTQLAQLLTAAVIASASVILWSIVRSQSTKAWFSHQPSL